MYETLLAGLIGGYMLWILAMTIYQDISYHLFNEAGEGNLEQLYMSQFDYIRVTAFRLIAGLILNSGTASVILMAMMLFTGRFLNLG